MKFSIIVNCRNSELFIEQTIESVIKQIYTIWELIIINNNSTDNTSEILLKYTDSRIFIYTTKNTLTLAAARNLALTYCTGDFISFLDSDDYYNQNRLEEIIKYTNISDFIFSNFYTLENNLLLKSKSINTETIFTRDKLIFNYIINLQTVAFRASIFKKFNIKFNEFLNIVEEYDFFIRYLTYTNKIKYIDEPLIVYRMHINSLSSKFLDLAPNELNLVANNWFSEGLINIKQSKKLLKKVDYLKVKQYLYNNNKLKALVYSLRKFNLILFLISIIGYKNYKILYYHIFKRVLVP